MNFIKFLFSKTFIVNVIIALIITGGGLFYVFEYLEDYTLHAETITVPDFTGFKASELDDFISDKQLEYVIVDSIYDGSKAKGVVLDQIPKPDAQVKDGRKIYLTINAINTPKVQLPEIKDLSIRQASAKLESYGLQVGELISRPSTCVNCALGMMVDGEEIVAGAMLAKNSEVDILIGVGQSGETLPVPFLLNLTLDQAKDWLKSLSLNVGAVNIEDCENLEDSASALIYKQLPEKNDENVINLGGSMDLWLTADSTKISIFLPDSVFAPTDSIQ